MDDWFPYILAEVTKNNENHLKFLEQWGPAEIQNRLFLLMYM